MLSLSNPEAPCFFSCSLWIKHSAQDCQNPSCHGEGNRLRGCYIVYQQERGTKRHFALTFRTILFTQQFLIWRLGMFMNVSYLLTIREQHRALWEACYRTTYFMSVHAHSALGSWSHICFFSKSKNKSMNTGRQSVKTTYSDAGKKKLKNNMAAGNEQHLGMIKAKFSPKCNLGFFWECTRVRPSRKSIIKTKEPLLRFTVFLFSG